MTRNLQPLLANNWIALENGTDARNKLISITKSGSSKLGKALVCWKKAQQTVNDAMGVEKVVELQALIDECLGKLES